MSTNFKKFSHSSFCFTSKMRTYIKMTLSHLQYLKSLLSYRESIKLYLLLLFMKR